MGKSTVDVESIISLRLVGGGYMETERQKSKCIRESTGTTCNLILAVLASVYFLISGPDLIVGLISTISLVLLGRNVKPLLLLALAIPMHIALNALIIHDTMFVRFYSLVGLLLIGCFVLYIITRRMKIVSIGLATVIASLAFIPLLLVLLKLDSDFASCGLIYVYILFISKIFGMFLLASLIVEIKEC